MKVALYIDPVDVVDNPKKNYYWVDTFLKLFSSSGNELLLIASRFILQEYGKYFDECYYLSGAKFLEYFDFDRNAYAIAVARALPDNLPVFCVDAFAPVLDSKPDIIFSFTENVFLKKMFPNAVLYTEFGPIPRYLFKSCLFVDPVSHLSGSVFSRYVASGERFEISSDLASHFKSKWLDHMSRWATHIGVPQWLATISGTSPLRLVALQPERGLSYIGLKVKTYPNDYLRAISRAHPDEVIVPVWHPSTQVCKDLVDSLEFELDNIRVPPGDLSVGKSEMFVQYVNSVSAVSSNVLFCASLIGKVVDPLTESRFSVLRQRLPGSFQLDLLGFCDNGYSTPVELIRENPNCWLRKCRDLLSDPNSLFLQKCLFDRKRFDIMFGVH